MTASHAALRNMIDCQLLTNEVTDPAILKAITETPREHFVPELFRGTAYADNLIPLGHKRYILCPLTQGHLLQHAAVRPHHKVLHIAAGLGYLTTLLSKLASRVIGIESQHELMEDARSNLQRDRVVAELFHAGLTVGYPIAAAYDVILIEGAVQQIPSGLLDQLAEGGRLVTVQNIQQRVEGPSGIGRILVIQKENGEIRQTLHQDVVAPFLFGFEKKTEFNL